MRTDVENKQLTEKLELAGAIDAAEARRSRAVDEQLLVGAALDRAFLTSRRADDPRVERLRAKLRDAEEELKVATRDCEALLSRMTTLKVNAQRRVAAEILETNLAESVAHQRREQGKRDAAAREAHEWREAGIKRHLDG
jgi:hypothetical protein